MLEILEEVSSWRFCAADPQHSVAYGIILVCSKRIQESRFCFFLDVLFFLCVFFHVYESMRCYAPSEREIHERLLEFDAFLQRLPGRLDNCVSHLPRFATADVVMVVLRQAQTGDAGALRR